MPENSLLSHDLFESLFARAALITEIELLDDYPAHYEAYAKRQHRWTRGDWQNLALAVSNCSGCEQAQGAQHVAADLALEDPRQLASKLGCPIVVPFVVSSLDFFPGSALLWSIFLLLPIAFPVYLHVTTSLLIHPRGIPWTSHFWSVWGDFRTNTAQAVLSIVLLPHQAYLMCDAIVRTLYRKLYLKRKLLEWVSAAQAESSARHDLPSFLRSCCRQSCSR